MNQYILQLREYLKEREARGGFSGIASMMEFLWQCYASENPVDDGAVRKAEERLDPILRQLSIEDNDAMYSIITDLATAYQRAAFLEGMTVGARLTTELIGFQ